MDGESKSKRRSRGKDRREERRRQHTFFEIHLFL
jgi:hypothetical protein